MIKFTLHINKDRLAQLNWFKEFQNSLNVDMKEDGVILVLMEQMLQAADRGNLIVSPTKDHKCSGFNRYRVEHTGLGPALHQTVGHTYNGEWEFMSLIKNKEELADWLRIIVESVVTDDGVERTLIAWDL